MESVIILFILAISVAILKEKILAKTTNKKYSPTKKRQTPQRQRIKKPYNNFNTKKKKEVSTPILKTDNNLEKTKKVDIIETEKHKTIEEPKPKIIQKNKELYNSLYTKNKLIIENKSKHLCSNKISTTKLSKKLSIHKKQLDNILLKLGYIDNEKKLTSLGIQKSGEYKKGRYGAYIVWNEDLDIQDLNNNKEKGDKYEVFIAQHYRDNGFYVWEHGKEFGVKDSSIDLIVKRKKELYFIQCKNWEKWKINHKEIKATQTDIENYLNRKPEFRNLIKGCERKLLYITPKECLTNGAWKYIQEYKDIIDYKVIPFK